MDWQELLRHQVLIVSGKGGTGKSTVAAALAVAATGLGRSALLVEVEGRREITRTLDEPAAPTTQERLTSAGPSVLSIDPVEAAIECLHIYGGGIDRLTRPLLRSGVLEQVIGVAPGFRDLLITGKLYEIGRLRHTDRRDRGRPEYDLLVVDSPPTGQIGAFLDAPRTFAGLMHVGPLKRRASAVAEFLHERARVVLVAVPEEMSVAETLETIPNLRSSGVRLAATALNRVVPKPLPRGTAGALRDMNDDRVSALAMAAGLVIAPDRVAELRSDAEATARRSQAQAAFREALGRAGPILELPEVPAATTAEVVGELAALLGAGGHPAPTGRRAVPPGSWPSVRSAPRSVASLGPHLAGARIVVTCGAGGVGKTSVSAAIALRKAAAGTPTVLLTVDPARRLATALHLPMMAGERVVVPAGAGRSLQAMQLDTQRTFDELIERMAGSPERRDRILSNPFYRRIADTLSGTHEYMAMEKLYELDVEEDHELVVIDTPPTRSALSFLEAPNRLTDFLGGRFLRWMLWPTARAGRFTLSAARLGAGAFLRTAGRLIGAEVLADTIDFLSSFEGMYGGFKDRAERVLELLRSPECAFVVVTAPGQASLEEAGYFVDRLSGAGMRLASVVVNRWQPVVAPLGPAAWDAAERLGDGASKAERAAGALLLSRLRTEPRRAAQARSVAGFARSHPDVPLLAVPELAQGVHDVAGLRRLAAHLFDG